jgi:hypothetical protein
MPDSPRLLLFCGKCNTAHVATASTQAAPLPGESFGVVPESAGRWDSYPRRQDPDTFVHVFTCKPCRTRLPKVTGARLANWWNELAGSGQAETTRYVGRDL